MAIGELSRRRSRIKPSGQCKSNEKDGHSTELSEILTIASSGITISQKLQKLFWTQKGGSKAGRGRIFSAAIDIPKGSNPNNRQDIAVVSDGLPEPIDLDFDDDNGILYWTDRGEVPLGNTLNKKTLIGPARDAEKALDREIIAQGFAEAIGLRLDKARQRIYVTDLSGSLWECMTEPGPKTKIYERAGHSYTGLAIVKY